MAYTNIDDPSAYFQTFTYSGTSNTAASYTFTGNSNMKPDLVWLKQRGYSDNHYLFDSTRGAEQAIYSNLTNAEANHNSSLTSFNTNGFSVGTSNVVSGGGTYVTWNWKANGGTTSSNTDGNTTTTVQANQDAGFSIVTYTGTGSGSQTMGHGLGVTPNIVLTKNRSGTGRAWSFNGNFGGMTYGTNKLILNQTSALTADTNDVTAASSTTFTGGGSNGVNANGVTYVAYCFAEKQGYSKFGKYVGNGVGTGDGPFVYLGFKPAFLLLKNITNANNWRILDNKRLGYNPNNYRLSANADSSESTTEIWADLLSNGFKLRTNEGSVNAANTDYIYMAFAENPFTTSTGIPTTAR